MIVKSIRVVALGVLLAVAVAGSASAQSVTGRTCEYLKVTSFKSETPMELVKSSVTCKRGSIYRKTDNTAEFKQKSGHGPNCTMTFREVGGKRYSTFRVQQNLCVMRAGDITVQMHLGAAVKYTKTEGSYAKVKNGRIQIIDFK